MRPTSKIIQGDRLYTRLLIIFLLLTSHLLLFSQCFKGNTAFGPGEKLIYDVAYTVGPAWTSVAQVTFETFQETLNGKEVLHLKISGRTDPSYEFLFKVRDYFETWIDPTTFRPVKFNRNTFHDGVHALLNWFYYPNQSLAVYTIKVDNGPLQRGTFKAGPCVHDMVTSVYYPRTLNIDYLRVGTSVPISTIYNTTVTGLYMISVGKEIIETRNGKRYHCTKFKIKMNKQISMFKENSEVLVWFTSDANRIPVYIEAELKVGTIRVSLQNATGLRNPNKALLN